MLVGKYSALTGYRWGRYQNYLPNRWIRVNATVSLFNRIVQDQIDVSQMKAEGGIWETLANAYEAYRNSLAVNRSCDFAHLQLKFLYFLNSPSGSL